MRPLFPALALGALTLSLSACGGSGGGAAGNASGGDAVQEVGNASSNDTGFVGPDGKPISEEQAMNQVESNTDTGADTPAGNSAQ